MQYNNSQLEAINHINGPALVLAGAGSGKTRVITGRIENLILNHGIKPTNILAVTFTNKAAGEMAERISEVLKERGEGVLCSTFHAFGVKILRENLKLAGLKYNFSIYTSSEQMMLVKKSMFTLNIAEDMFDPRLVLWKMMKYKSENLQPEQVVVIDPLGSVAKRVYANYKILLAESNAVDFEDLLLRPLLLLQSDKKILEKYQEHYKYILVDEFQDTNIVQYNMLKLLAGKSRNLFVVGDDDQSIYGFRGAHFENILNFDKEWEGTKSIILNVNYRSNNTILTASHSVIKNNKQRKEKTVYAHNQDEMPLEYFEGFDERNEAEKIAEKIESNLKNKKYSKFAVLMRANHQSRVLEEIFRAERIPYNLVGGRKFYDRKEIKDIIAYFTILNNPSAEVAFLRIINTPKRGIGAETIFKISDFAKAKNIRFFDALKRYKEIKTIADSRHYNLKSFLELLNKYMQKRDVSLFKHLTNFVFDSSYLSMLDKLSLPEKKIIDKKNSINELLNSVAEYERKVKKPTLNGFLERISLIQDSDAVNSEEQVQVMTIHASKGLEFDTVFICGLEEGIFPHERSIEENNIEEERRLCYVALTRAENRLFLSSASSRNKYGKVEKSKQSRFIREISKDLFVKNPVKSDNEKITDAKDMIKSLLGL